MVPEIDEYEFDVTIDLDKDPIEICFTPDQPLPANPEVTVTLKKGDGTLSNGIDTIPPKSELPVSPVENSCSDIPTYCVDYEPAEGDSEAEVWINEDPTNPVIPGFVGFGVAKFEINTNHYRATSFCVYNVAGGVGCLQGIQCNTDSVIVMLDSYDLDLSGAKNNNGDSSQFTNFDCVPVKIVEVDKDSIPAIIPETSVVLPVDISLPDGVVIAANHSITIIFNFDLPAGWSQQEFEDNLQVIYYDEDTGSWKSDGISNVTVDWDTPTSGNISFETKHLTQFAASSKSTGGSGVKDGDDSQSASGGGCSVASTNHDISTGSAMANTLLLLLPLIIIRFRKKRKGE
jgi:hypothetical protein